MFTTREVPAVQPQLVTYPKHSGASSAIAARQLDVEQLTGCLGTRRKVQRGEYLLRMTREEIGSLLGLELETVSQVFSRFQDEGLLSVHNRDIDIKDLAGLGAVIGRSDMTH